MQHRHTDRKQYFTEQSNTSKEYYLNYVNAIHPLSGGMRVLEVGCGEGGNLLPFAEIGCRVSGIDISAKQIDNAKQFFLRERPVGRLRGVRLHERSVARQRGG
ncbi:MAG: type 12 methyltransferase [bacterium P3]|nr:MAG: type 12 methyltransferase [bacterium P3]KWW39003.1 MAG: type 12 methyltransferase [bacterium F083]